MCFNVADSYAQKIKKHEAVAKSSFATAPFYATDFELSERIYDYSSMKIVKPSNGEYVNITIDTYTLEDKTVKNISLTFVYERGDWYLDSPTY